MGYTLPYEEVYERGLEEIKIIDNNYPSSFAYQSGESRTIYDSNTQRSLADLVEEITALEMLQKVGVIHILYILLQLQLGNILVFQHL